MENIEALQQEIRSLQEQLQTCRNANLDLRTDLAIRESTIRIRDAEISQLSAVVARNLIRVQAETAKAAAQIAQSTQPTRQHDD